MQIRKNRTKDELTEDNKGKRRRKGTALGAYALVKGTKMFSPDLDLAVIEASNVKKKVNVKAADDESQMEVSAITGTDSTTDTEDADIQKGATQNGLPDFPPLDDDEQDETRKLKVRTIVVQRCPTSFIY